MVKHLEVLVSDSRDAADGVKTARRLVEKAFDQAVGNREITSALVNADAALRRALLATDIELPEHIAVWDEHYDANENRVEELEGEILNLNDEIAAMRRMNEASREYSRKLAEEKVELEQRLKVANSGLNLLLGLEDRLEVVAYEFLQFRGRLDQNRSVVVFTVHRHRYGWVDKPCFDERTFEMSLQRWIELQEKPETLEKKDCAWL